MTAPDPPSPPSPYAPPAAAPSESLGKPSPVVAALLTLFCSLGTGHVYAGRTLRGLAWACAPIVVVALAAGLVHGARSLAPIAGIVVMVSALVIAAIVDAARCASRSAARGSTLRVLGFLVVFAVVSVAIRLGMRVYVLEAYKIPSGSMQPAVGPGDHILIDKTRAPARGDVVAFPFPEHPEQDFVKRIVGMPGDRIEFTDGHPKINGHAVPSCVVGPWSYDELDDPAPRHEGRLYAEKIGDHVVLAFYDESSAIFLEEQGPWVVEPGEVFVLGDNRNNAHDSRMWYGGRGGGVPLGTVRGVAFAIWLSVTPSGITWSRAGAPLDEPHLPPSASSLAPALAKCVESLRAR